MSLAESLIQQSFAQAEIADTTPYSAMILGLLREIGGQPVRAVALFDNGLAGLKLAGLTAQALVIIDQWGGVHAQHGIGEIVEIDSGWSGVDIVYQLPNGARMRHSFNHKDRDGARAMAREFERLADR